MARHPSLTAPVLKADLITPVETMGRNEPCWCHSGLKYKRCHSGRERQAPVNVFEVEERLIAQLQEGYCSHPDPTGDPCSPTLAKAHTIQKKGGIAGIAEAGHVLTVKPIMKDLIESRGNPSPRKIGVNNASVFPGFCNKHDTTLFRPIEGKSLSLDKNTSFLFAYRAIAYERFAKDAQFKGIAAQRERIFVLSPKLGPNIPSCLRGWGANRQARNRWLEAEIR
jgi:SEC-C motif